MDTKTKVPAKLLVAKPGLDGHDVGAKVVARALHNEGFEVVYTGLHQAPKAIADAVLEEDVDILGLSILSGAHVPLCKKLFQELEKRGLTNIPVIIGGVIPEKDFEELYKLGVKKIFPTDSNLEDIIQYVRKQTS